MKLKDAIKFGFGFYLGKVLLDVAGDTVTYLMARWMKDHAPEEYRQAMAKLKPETYETVVRRHPDLAI